MFHKKSGIFQDKSASLSNSKTKLYEHLFLYLQAETYKLVSQMCHDTDNCIIPESRKSNQKSLCASYLHTNTDQFLFSLKQKRFFYH